MDNKVREKKHTAVREYSNFAFTTGITFCSCWGHQKLKDDAVLNRKGADLQYLHLKLLNEARSLPAWTAGTLSDSWSSAILVLASHNDWCTSRTHQSAKRPFKKTVNYPVSALCYYCSH